MSQEIPNQDLSALVALISDLQKTIAILTEKLSKYEENEVLKKSSHHEPISSGASGTSGASRANKYQGRFYEI